MFDVVLLRKDGVTMGLYYSLVIICIVFGVFDFDI